jgi:hypothetical protein
MELRQIAGTVVMSLELAVYAWPITMLVLIAGIAGVVASVRQRKLRAWQSLTVFASLLFPALIAPAYAVRYWADTSRGYSQDAQSMPLNILMTGWAMFALVLIAAISLARGFRLPLAGAASLVVWFGAGVYMISVMAVSGVWM